MSGGQERFLRATMPAADVVFNLARRLTPSAADAEDLVQETYTRAWAAWIDGRRPRNAAPWLATICLNAGRDRLRRTATDTEVPMPPGLRVPDDVRLIGYDDISEAEFMVPALSKVAPDHQWMAEKAVELVIKRIHTPLRQAGQYIAPFELVIRESTHRSATRPQ
ncbi:substrate-binding domain-containing protein [Nonomuraea sp. NPDC050153]|uniref:substrate-binding domain-containing protein n=1 Tax=Nonomuraea sp. NPDC050153 TaxID=3364359 RepID=UPI0037B6494B